MSAESDIEEDIEDLSCDYTDDEELQKDVDISPDIADPLMGDSDAENQTNTTNGIKTDGTTCDTKETVKVAIGAANTIIERFSRGLADTLVKEALVIHDIYEKDKLNAKCLIYEDVTEENSINRSLERAQDANAEVDEGGPLNASYDRYLINKLLHSEADPAETSECNGFDGKEENFTRETEHRYPGRDANDADVKEEMEICETNDADQNNNQLNVNIGDGILQTIPEDAVLEIDTEFCENKLEAGDNSVLNGEGETTMATTAIDTEVDQTQATVDTEASQPINQPQSRGVKEDMSDEEGECHDEKADSSSEESDDSDVDDYCCEMTPKQTRAVVRAVRDGNIDKLEDLLEKKNADMNMLWYGETLLMVAIRADQEEMAEFLIDNGVNLDHLAKLVEREENGAITMFKVNARQMAFDRDMDNLVELLDLHGNNLFHFVRPRERQVRMRRPPPPTPPPPSESDDDFSYDAEEDVCRLPLNDDDTSDTKSNRRTSNKDNDDSGLQSVKTTEDDDNENEKREKVKRHKSITDTEYTDKTDITDKESVHTASSKHTDSHSNRSQTESNEDISRVFGMDEGYETMSPISQTVPPHVHKLEYNVVGTKEHVNVRGTRASLLLKAHNSTYKPTKPWSAESGDDLLMNDVKTVGSYNFESRRWHQSRSAPAPRNYSVESIPDAVMRLGIPFVHGGGQLQPRSAGSKTPMHGRSYSARTTPSPFSEVTQLLAGSKLLNPATDPRTSTPNFPTIHNKKTYTDYSNRTRINYIYASRNSNRPHERITFCDISSPRTKSRVDLLPKRKLNK